MRRSGSFRRILPGKRMKQAASTHHGTIDGANKPPTLVSLSLRFGLGAPETKRGRDKSRPYVIGGTIGAVVGALVGPRPRRPSPRLRSPDCCSPDGAPPPVSAATFGAA